MAAIAFVRAGLGWLFGTQTGRAVLIAAAIVYVLWAAYGWAWQRGHDIASDAGQREIAALRADIDAQRMQAEVEARAAEERQRAALRGVELEYMRELEHAATVANEALAELRVGNLRLRNHWQGCVATSELSSAAAVAASADAGAELRAAGAADLVRIGADADARVRALQHAYRSVSD